MLINTFTFSILVFLLVWHAVRLLGIWHLTRAVPVDSALFIPALTLQLIALISDHDWAIWIAALLLGGIIVWSFNKCTRDRNAPPAER